MRSELREARTFLLGQLPQGGRVLCAVSGGLDSMCLLDFMTTWGTRAGFTAVAAHFHHGLRGAEADRDEAFVRDFCARRSIPFCAGRGDTRALAQQEGKTLEEAARELRYRFLETTAEEEGCVAILTAHHADDNAETMLLNLIRGTGSRGLAGIPQVRDQVLRPFLRIPREALAAYAAERDLPHVEDSTNADADAADRNALRHRVLPVLRELNPRAVEHMARTAGILERESQAMEGAAETLAAELQASDRGWECPCAALALTPEAVAERAALLMLARCAGRRKDLTAEHVSALMMLAKSPRTAGAVSLPYGLTAYREGKHLVLCREHPREALTLREDGPTHWGTYTLTLLDHRQGEGLALRAGTEPITVKTCPAGGFLTLPGSRGPRSVKRLCLDRGISLREREGLPALFLGDRLAAVWRLGVDEAFAPEGGALRFVTIQRQAERNQTEEKKKHDE